MKTIEQTIEKILIAVGDSLYTMRMFMSFYYIGLSIVMLSLLYKFSYEIYKFLKIVLFDTSVEKITLIIKVLELVDMAMVAQLVWVVCLAGFSLFVTSRHFNDPSENDPTTSGKQAFITKEKPDWLDHVNTYNLKLKLAFAVISISGVHTLKIYLEGAETEKLLVTITVHFLFVLSAVGIALAERIIKKDEH